VHRNGRRRIGVANVFGQFLCWRDAQSVGRGAQRPNLFLGFALAEAFGIFSLLIAMLLLFVL
jgi:F-type H+-transporting ATPase subunit c